MSYMTIEPEVIRQIVRLGFRVYMPTKGLRTYLYYTDGTRLAYMQRGDWGGLSISTAHIPNHTSGTGFRVTDNVLEDHQLTKEALEEGFMDAPRWASDRDRASVHKWPNMEAFLAANAIVPLECVGGYLNGREDYAAIRDEANEAGEGTEVSGEEYEEMLEVLPPIYVRGGFLVMEAITGDERGTVHAMYAKRGERFFAKYVVANKPETYIP